MEEGQPIEQQILDHQTDTDDLEDIADSFDIDDLLDDQISAILKQFTELEINYRTLLNSRRFLNNGG